ncbi:MAG: hypothetical protein H6704_23355 [Myxococcales bacterium]|nr:hypothetical protein [Myxococcales bacterium]MCB9539170.1 hypothetical protein [Myxococcales bacterium]
MRYALLAALVGLSAGCGSTLTIRHLDATHRSAEVMVNGEKKGMLTYGESFEMPLEPGRYQLKVTAPGKSTSPWHPDVDTIDVMLEDDAVLTLQPPRPR